MNEKIFDGLDKIIPWRRLEDKDREEVMQNLASHENWKSCFSEVAPGLLLFARQWVHSAADAEDVDLEKAVGSLIAAEKAYAKLAADKGFREASISVFADDAVIFATSAVNGKKFCRAAKEDEGRR